MPPRAVLSVLILICGSPWARALDATEETLLWPAGAPGAVGEEPLDRPTITIHSPRRGALESGVKSPAVIICPGGGYGFLAISYEGHDVAKWLSSFGVTGVVLKYRIAPRYGHPAPMQDVQRAIRFVRAHAAELGVEPTRIGVLGFSAGGHLAATASTLFSPGRDDASDPIERVSSRPDFTILAYPVVTMTSPHTHAGSRRNLLGPDPDEKLVRQLSLETRVSEETPPAFLFHTGTDKAVPVENSLLYYTALRAAGIPAELHVYREGPHGVGLDRHPATSSWPSQLKLWMEHLGLFEPVEDPAPKWIWLADDSAQRVYFRKWIDITGPIEHGSFVGTCDNRMNVFVNGRRVLSSDQWEVPLRANLTSVLREGRNLIAVEAQNDGGPGGFLAQVTIEPKKGVPHVVSTSRDWKVSSRRQRRWRDEDVDEARWSAATELAGLGTGPWAQQVSAASLAAAAEPAPLEATPAECVKLHPDFRVELLYSVPREEEGSWVSMTVDGRGRLITSDQYGSLYRFAPPAPGKKLADSDIEKIDLDIGGAHGLLYAFDSLYVVRGEGSQGLYRVRDKDGDDRFDSVELLRRIPGGGEHGPHSIILSPDGKSLYIAAGNHTDLPDIEKSLVPRVWQEDLLLPRQWDASGHARGRMAPGGWIAQLDPDGKVWEIVSIGYRNEFDIAFSPEGELFTYDADMEWDIGSPWYRPTRVNHAVSGSEFGWRSGTGKWPEYFPDSLGSVVDIGPGSPTGITFGSGANFPEKYQRALFICDWSFGKMYAVHLEPDGATWKGTAEQFMAASPLPLTDLVVNRTDGALYATIGGRRAQSGLYRITHKGPHRAQELTPRVTPAARLRRELERYHVGPDPRAVEAAWPHLSHADRNVRFAARVAIEHQPVASWQERAVSEANPIAAIEAAIALARHGDRSLQAKLIASLDRIRFGGLDEPSRLALLRAYQLAFIRMGESDAATRSRLARRLDPHYPSPSARLNRELGRLLVYLESKDVVPKTLALLKSATTQEDQIHYALILRTLRSGWTLETRKQYFEWFAGAGSFHGGHSFQGFLRNIKREAVATLTDEEKKTLGGVLEATPVSEPLAELPQPVGPGREWKVDDLLPLELKGRDFENGRNMFAGAYCFSCHRFAGQGAAAAPDLTAVSGRFNQRDLLESIIEPSKVISDQYQATIFHMRDGTPIIGRIVNLGGDNLSVNTNMLDPNQNVGVDVRQVESMTPSGTSMMPTGLLDRLNRDEVLDLMAYLLSGGDGDHAFFRK